MILSLLACTDPAPIDSPEPPADTAWPARCGDGVVDEGEACDDGETWGGDGCSPECAVESGTFEKESNDDPSRATPFSSPAMGSLRPNDVDCWSIEAAACDAISVVETGECGSALVAALYDPSGAWVASGAPGEDGCLELDPADQPGARWVEGGAWALCVQAVNAKAVPVYTLELSAAPSGDLQAGADVDGDGAPDSCDDDIDGDGLEDALDDCPMVSNGPETPPLALSASGYVTDWLAAGPFTGRSSSGGCRPSEEAIVGEDGAFAPELADAAGDAQWIAWFTGESFDVLSPYDTVSAPREAYALVYLESPTARTATLAVGADDGVFAWWNGALILDVSGCQGVNPDQFKGTVEVKEGVNTLLLKVFDQGGGWGLSARLLDEGGLPITDLVPSLSATPGWAPTQGDSDGDGQGDVCDRDP